MVIWWITQMVVTHFKFWDECFNRYVSHQWIWNWNTDSVSPNHYHRREPLPRGHCIIVLLRFLCQCTIVLLQIETENFHLWGNFLVRGKNFSVRMYYCTIRKFNDPPMRLYFEFGKLVKASKTHQSSDWALCWKGTPGKTWER